MICKIDPTFTNKLNTFRNTIVVQRFLLSASVSSPKGETDQIFSPRGEPVIQSPLGRILAQTRTGEVPIMLVCMKTILYAFVHV